MLLSAGCRVWYPPETLGQQRCNAQHENWMRAALELARQAGKSGEVAVGCVIVENNQVLGEAHNEKEASQDPTAHAEILAIRRSTRRIGDWQLPRATLYVTLEPCPMCMGAILEARIPKVVFGTYSSQGAATTCLPLANFPGLAAHCEIVAGVLQDECEQVTQEFFRELR